MKGGKLSAPELKGLLDASYDSKVKKVGDFEMDKKLSSSTSKVYRNPVTGQVVVAHRGTAGISDWGNNALYAIGGKRAYKLTPRYKEAEKVQRRAEKKYGADSVTTIGHSQGGLQSELLGGRSKEIITLNKATLPFESNTNKNQYDIRSERDVVSGLNPFAKKSKKDVNIKAKTYNPLTEHSGDVLDRLGKNKVIGKGVYLKGYSRMRGGASRGRQPTRQPREEEGSLSPEPPPPLRRQIIRRLEEIRLKFERDEGSVTFTPEERAVLEEERNRLTTMLSRMSGGVVVSDDEGDDGGGGGDEDDEYDLLIDVLERDIIENRQLLNDDFQGAPDGSPAEQLARTKLERYVDIHRELAEMVDTREDLDFLRLALEYMDDYIDRDIPFTTLQDWRMGALFR